MKLKVAGQARRKDTLGVKRGIAFKVKIIESRIDLDN